MTGALGPRLPWTVKARVQRTLARLPGAQQRYVQIQRRFGNLSADPGNRVEHHLRMMRLLHEAGIDPAGARVLEVGTGHHPTVPLLFHLVGAREIVTVDLHRRLQRDDLPTLVRRLAAMGEGLTDRYEGLADTVAMRRRLLELAALDDPELLLDRAGVTYVAPGDAGAMPDPDGSYDLHVSTTVLEHVEPEALGEILREATRLLRPGGVACHLIDPSDHFAHGDQRISRVNFLRFSQTQWSALAGNEFAFHNRLRSPELVAAFANAGLSVVTAEEEVDDRSLSELESGFPVDDRFAGFSPRELATTSVDIAAVQP